MCARGSRTARDHSYEKCAGHPALPSRFLQPLVCSSAVLKLCENLLSCSVSDAHGGQSGEVASRVKGDCGGPARSPAADAGSGRTSGPGACSTSVISVLSAHKQLFGNFQQLIYVYFDTLKNMHI